MLEFFLLLTGLSILVSVLFAGGTYYQSEKLPEKTPSKYLIKQIQEGSSKSVVVFMGDSITHGRIGVNYVEMIEDQLKGKDIEFINAGINSELVWNILQRVDEVIQCEPNIVTVLIGSNDANASMAESNKKSYVRRMKLPRDPDIDWYKESLVSLVKKLQKRTSAKIALLSIPTIGEDPNNPAFIRSSEYSKIVQDVAKEMDVAYLPLHENMVEFLQDTSTNASYPYEKYFGGIIKGIINHYLLRRSWDRIGRSSGFLLHVDYLHLNTEGARMIANLISEFLQSNLTQT